MSIKQSIIRILNPRSKLFRILYQIRHPIRTFKRIQMLYSKSSIFNDESNLNDCTLMPTALLEGTFGLIKPASVLDVGCGTGRSLDWFLEKEIKVYGLEGSRIGIKHARNPQYIKQTDLNHSVDLGRRFDLVWCFEVAEHIHPNFTENFLHTLTRHGDCVMMSAAHPGQGGTGHFNEQPRSYWLRRFEALGFVHDDSGRDEIIKDWTWYPENIFLFRKKNDH